MTGFEKILLEDDSANLIVIRCTLAQVAQVLDTSVTLRCIFMLHKYSRLQERSRCGWN